jgi:hypothetical protein
MTRSLNKHNIFLMLNLSAAAPSSLPSRESRRLEIPDDF